MQERAARKVMSGWSSFRLGMTRPELSVLGLGEWGRPGGDDWGIIIRDLRSGEERVVFDEAEWERIKRRGLPPVGTPWGDRLKAKPELPSGVEEVIAVERDLYHASKMGDKDQEASPQTSSAEADAFAEFVRGLIEEPTQMDHRILRYLLPANARLKRDVTAQFSKGIGVQYSAVISWRGIECAFAVFAWPKEPDEKVLAFLLNSWLLLVEGKERNFTLTPWHRGTANGLEFTTNLNSFGSLRIPPMGIPPMGMFGQLFGQSAKDLFDRGLRVFGTGNFHDAEPYFLEGLAAYDQSKADPYSEDLGSLLGCLVSINIKRFEGSGSLRALDDAVRFERRKIAIMEHHLLPASDAWEIDKLRSWYEILAGHLRHLGRPTEAQEAMRKAREFAARTEEVRRGEAQS